MFKKIIFILSFLILSSTIASAASDIAYIYRKDFKIDHIILDTFAEMSLTVDLINENNLPSDLSSYRAVFIGDERLKKAEQIQVNKYPSIISSYYQGNIWGITDRDGVSQLGSTSPLRIMKNGDSITVYTQAFQRNKIAVPYYFLDNQNKNPSLTQIAATQTTSSGYKFGDVISQVSPGYLMSNGKIQQANLCFFGIIESDYWTTEAKEMFKDCVDFAIANSAPASACSQDADCPTESTSEPFCMNDNLYETTTSFTCQNPGEASAQCVSQDNSILIEECSFGCELGVCLSEPAEEPVCSSDEDCPENVFSAPYCEIGTEYEDKNLYQTMTSYSCENPGEASAQCVSQQEIILTEDCLFGCYLDSCLAQPEEPTLMHDVSLVDFSDAINNIKITDSEDALITSEPLTCGEKYKIIIKIDNAGNYTENVTFEGTLGSQTFSHISLTDFIPGDSKTKTRTITLGEETGTFDLIVQSILQTGTDSFPSDNTATRAVTIVCED